MAPMVGRQSPPPEIRPLVGASDIKHSPSTSTHDYRGNQSYSQPAPIMQPPPTAALQAAEAQAARDRDDRAPVSFKRPPDEDEYNKGPNKKISNGDRRHDDAPSYARTSPKEQRPPSPRLQRRSSSESRREQANRDYHPSEAAHHPPTLPALQQQQHSEQPSSTGGQQGPPPPPSSLPQPSPGALSQQQQANQAPARPPSAASQHQHQLPPIDRPQEGAARKNLDIDEDYNDAGGDEDRRTSGVKTSPKLTNGQTKTEPAA